MAIFDPPQNRHPSTDHQKICHRLLRRRPLRLCQIRCISVHGGLLGTWVKYNQNYFYLCPFFQELTYTSDTSTDFHAWWLKRRRLAPGCAFFGNFSHCSPFRGQKPPQNSQFWGVNRRFQAKLAKSKNVHIIKTTASIPTKFCTVIKTTKCPSWVVTTHALQIQDGGRPPSWKNGKIVISQPRFARFWRNLVSGCSSTLLTILTVKNWNFQNPRWRWPPSWKIEKSPYLSRGSTDFDQIWHDDALRTSWPSWPSKIWNFANPRWWRLPSWKSKNSHISAAVWAISTKFGTIVQFNPLERPDR